MTRNNRTKVTSTAIEKRVKPKLKSLDETERKNVLAYVNGAAMAAENRKIAEKDIHESNRD